MYLLPDDNSFYLEQDDESLTVGPIVDLTQETSPEEVKKTARAYARQALEALALIMTTSPSHNARINAANSILDRAYGKATQPLANDKDNPIGAVVQLFALPDNGRENYATEDEAPTVN